MSNVSTIGLPGPSGTPRVQYASSWSIVTACQPAAFSACICAANSAEGTYSPGNGAPAGGGLITWYMSTGTVAVPGLAGGDPGHGDLRQAARAERLGMAGSGSVAL